MKKNPKARVSRITIGRLYNLGNYEHVRYELSVDVPEGTKPSKAFVGIMKILRAANPKPPNSLREVEEARAVIAKKPEDRTKWDSENLETYQRRIAAHEIWSQRREKALAMLDALGGTREHKDAKDDWAWGDEDY